MFTPNSPRTASAFALISTPALALVAILLTGCAWAPGMYISDMHKTTTSGPFAGAAEDAPPPGALKSITPELIRQQRAAQATDVGEDVSACLASQSPT